MSRDGAAGLALLGGSLILLWATLHLPRSPLVPIGPEFYPRILLSVTAGLSALLFVSDLLRRRPRAAVQEGHYRKVILSFLIFGVYVFTLSPLGYRTATFLFMLVLQAVLDPPEDWGKRARILGIALGTTVVTYYTFEIYLFVLLPRGWITGF